ncbi:potassium/proton antiporter [Maledivibacter halophilus]|uniref:Potassium/proton antiporter, CPA1 family (TC 2.A.36) n=1 Tax=Maledivibacter halophilus TaxID=36842 RepID=A0A1T5IDB9_9FIRM|nr:potassium/proton antiporter [Maledivibacter halophilus]SKC37149.1 potassium/proton antiporter, CPA1 family (TC 2.A.36) [Maledivibacter halophilus]
MPTYLLIVTAIIIVCIIFNKISSKLGIPVLLAFILLGMFFGSDGIFKIQFDNFVFAEQICSIALIFIIFYGGFGTKWSEAKPVAAMSILLSTLGVILTAGITGLFCYFILKIEFLESMLIGSVISSTDAASVFSILRSKRLNLKYNTASLLELESGSNDPCSYMLTAIMLSLMGHSAHGGSFAYMIFAQLIYGIVFGVIVAIVALWVLKQFPFESKGFDTIFVFAIALLGYAAPAALGGNGYLSVYIVGIILGNRPIKNKQSLVHFFDGVTGLTQMLIFFLLGLLAFPSQMPQVVKLSIPIFLFLTFIARPMSVFLIFSPFKCKFNQQMLVSFSGLRGAASIVFAVMVTVSPAYTNHDVFHIVFCIVLFSILFQGSLLPLAAKKLDMIDENANVLKTFNDYTEEVPVQFIQFTMKDNHPWKGKKIRDILLPPETLLVFLQRGRERITPNGDTLLYSGDILVLSAKAPNIMDSLSLTELCLYSGNKWIGKSVSSIHLDTDKLIIMIQRNGMIVIPSGETILKENDLLVINQSEQ